MRSTKEATWKITCDFISMNMSSKKGIAAGNFGEVSRQSDPGDDDADKENDEDDADNSSAKHRQHISSY